MLTYTPSRIIARIAGTGAGTAMAVLLSVVAADGAAAEQPRPERTISVTGVGSVSVAPDRARMSLAVVTSSRQADAAAAENARITDAVLSALEKLIGPQDELRTGRYSLDAEYEYSNQGGRRERELVGYSATNAVVLTTSALDTVGKLIDAAVGAGANEVSSLTFSLSDESDARARAITEAGARALADADAIAKSLGVERGALLEATSADSGPTPRPMMRMAMAADAGGAAETPIAPGSVEVSARVSAVFAIK